MPYPNKPVKHGHGGGGESEFSTNTLWVGNLASDVNDGDLMEAFSKYGPIDDVTSYVPRRTYGFVYFKDVESAMAAKEALDGHVIKGSSIRIEFAKPAKPSKHVWVGGISSSVTKELLEEELSKFGNLEEFKFLRDRNTAFVEYARLEDASAAVKNLNGKQIGDDTIRVDYVRPLFGRREPFEFHDPRDSQFRSTAADPSWNHRDSLVYHSEVTNTGHKRQQLSESVTGRRDGQPSRVLWVGYPPSVAIDEQMLYTAMILYGEIERIKCFPSRHYAFVEFRSVEEARNAKEGLQGKLFNDPRISLMFSSSDLAPKDVMSPFSGFKGQRPDMFMSDVPHQPSMMDAYGHRAPNNFSSGPAHTGVLGPGLARDRLSPTPGVLSSQAFSSGNPSNNTRSGRDLFDSDKNPREVKRARIDGVTSFDDAPFVHGKVDDYVAGLEQPHGNRVGLHGHHLRPLPNIHSSGRFSPANVTSTRAPLQVRAGGDCIWRGVIAKGGSAVCNARCLLVSEAIDIDLPEVVNCSAKTGLDMLTKHYAEAVGFEIVFFLPDSEEDFASYTEFLRFLGSKGRAGVAKFADGTTMFLVPPSDFLTKVLNVVGPERLYGVVLKLDHHTLPNASGEQQANMLFPSIRPMNQLPGHLPDVNNNALSQNDRLLPMDHSKFNNEGSMVNTNLPLPPATSVPPIMQPPATSVPPVMQPPSQDPANAIGSASQSRVGLTPELIATLASLLPANSQASVAQTGAQHSLMSPSLGRFPDPTPAVDRSTYPQAWSQHHQPSDQVGHNNIYQYGNQLNYGGIPQPGTNLQPYPSISSVSSHPSQPQVFPEGLQMQNTAYNSYPQQGAVYSKPLSGYSDLSQTNYFVGSDQATHKPGQHETVPHNNMQRGYGMGQEMAPNTGPYGVPVPFTNQNPMVTSYSRPDNPAASMIDNSASKESTNNGPAVAASGLAMGEVEVDKNQRYQSTLQFAANLLQQIQQQGGSQPGHGIGN